jgi:hypothetical protein
VKFRDQEAVEMKTLTVEWQRLLDREQKTCPRCSSTEKEVEAAVGLLKQELAPYGIGVILRKTIIDPEAFRKDVLQSNKVVIAGKTLEEWLGATTGRSKCCETCGEAECRTVEYAGQVHEAVPSDLIVAAGLAAAASLYQLKVRAPFASRALPEKGSVKRCGS